jgi:hypothetical protein
MAEYLQVDRCEAGGMLRQRGGGGVQVLGDVPFMLEGIPSAWETAEGEVLSLLRTDSDPEVLEVSRNGVAHTVVAE